MTMNEFYMILNNKFGILPPSGDGQDWELTAGTWEQTSDYINFYHEYIYRLDDYQKYCMINMIIQGFDDMFMECLDVDPIYREKIWSRIKEILVNEKQTHMETIIYWSSLEQPLEDAFYCAKYMRELLRAIIGTLL